jgi:regulator of protease activity HflC (stomatin/prohibitin superfamily)
MFALFLVAVVVLLLMLGLVVCGFQVVRARQALVIYSSQTGYVRRVVAGPRLVFKLPLLEDAMVLDLSFQQVRLRLDELVTVDRLAVEASLDVDFELDGDLLRAADINLILPLLPKVGLVVENLASYLLRAMVAQFTAADLLARPALRARLERQLHYTLGNQLRWLGVRVLATRLLLHPAPMMLEAELTAQAQARALLALINTLGADRELLAQLLPLQLLQAQPGHAHLLASLNLQPAADTPSPAPALHWVVNQRP